MESISAADANLSVEQLFPARAINTRDRDSIPLRTFFCPITSKNMFVRGAPMSRSGSTESALRYLGHFWTFHNIEATSHRSK